MEMSLERALEYIGPDELVEVTPEVDSSQKNRCQKISQTLIETANSLCQSSYEQSEHPYRLRHKRGFMNKPKLLITGASGWLGWHLCLKASHSWDVHGTYYSHPLSIPQVQLQKVDLTDYEAIKQLFADINPAAVIHTAAQSQPNYCQQYPEISERINVVTSLNLAGLCAEYEIPCVFTSTDLVFDGLQCPLSRNR